MSVDAEIVRRASILSYLSAKYDEKRKSLPQFGNEEKGRPNDSFFIVHMFCLAMGFMNIMPVFFLNTAAGYWLYKFRDPSIQTDTTAGSDRTALQSYFQSSLMAAQTLPSIFFTSTLTLYGHKVSSMLRMIWSLILMIALVFIFTAFTQINTDSWQTGFFGMTICLVIINSALGAIIQMSSAVLIAKLPHEYMFYFLLGQNGTFLTTSIQIMSLSVTDSQPISGVIYFACGTFIIILTFILLLLSRISKIFKFYDVEDTGVQKPETISWEESKVIIKKIWPCLVIICFLITNISLIHPSITTLVVSENEADETTWTKKYFTAVSAFVVLDLSSSIGRIVSKKATITNSNKWWYIGITTLRLFITVPLYLFTRAEPRNLPVLLNKDWEFIVLNSFFGFSMGFMMNICFLSVQSLANGKQEGALKIMTLVLSFIMAATTANGLFMVKALKF